MDGGATPLCAAARNGHETVVRALIETGADINKARDDGVTARVIAAEKGHAAIVQLLRDAGAV
jgi:ankyrin repeat protein